MLALVVLGAGWFGYRAWQASQKLVTLNVRNLEVRKACRLIERQVWETIHVAKAVDGRVTLNVKRAPLNAVLTIVAEQVNARWSAVYPLYSAKPSLKKLEHIALGEEDDLTGWQAWRSGGRRFGAFGDALRDENQLVTAQVWDKDVEFAALALSRFARAQVVAEDGTTNKVRLLLRNAPMPDAVKQLAKQANRDWSVFYTLQPGFFGRGRPGPFGDEGTNAATAGGFATNAPGPPFFAGLRRSTNDLNGDTNQPMAGFGRRGGFMTPEMQAAMQRQMEAQMATMTREEQERTRERQQRFEELQNLSPEERRERMAEFFRSPEMQARMEERLRNNILNTTPEQRVERTQIINERRQRFQGTAP